MKKMVVKRLIFTDSVGNTYYGGHEYDGALSDHNILCSFHEIGKTIWINGALWTVKNNLRISVAPFYQYQKRWYESLLDAVRRI